MTIYQALHLAESGRKIYFTNLKIEGRFDNEKAMDSWKSSRLFDTDKDDEGLIFSVGTEYENIIILDTDGNVFVKDRFTPTPQEKEECAKYHVCDFWNLDDNQEIPFVRRRKPKDLVGKIADRIDEYIVKNDLPLNDPDEDENGQCVSSFMLADALVDDEVLAARAAKLTRGQLRTLCGMFMERTVWIDEEADFSYGEVFFLDLVRTPDGIRVEIWDGYPE